ncbi:Bacterial Ig-like domain (group 2) [compost metagenome]
MIERRKINFTNKMEILTGNRKSKLTHLYRTLIMLQIVLLFMACGREEILPIRINNITFRNDTISLAVGKSEQLFVKHTPEDIKDPDYIWSTADPKIATVENGIVYGHRVGETDVSVSVKGQNVKAKVLIRVLPVSPTALKLHATKTTLIPGEEVPVTYMIEPTDLSDTDQMEIEWNSSDTNVCAVDKGKIKAVAPGTAKVTAEIKGTAIKGELTIQVQSVPIGSIELTPAQAELHVGKELSLHAKVLPVNAHDQTLVWSSGDPQVATVTGGVIKGVNVGATTIKVANVDGKKSAFCKVTVKSATVDHIILSAHSLVMVPGEQKPIVATVLPEDVKDRTVIWTSSDNSIATVDAKGLVTGKTRGTAVINATSVANPQIYASCNLAIVNPDDQVFTVVSNSGRVSDNGYVSSDIKTLFENGSSDPVNLISFEVVSQGGELVASDYQVRIIATGMQQRHQAQIKKIYRPYVRYIFELKGKRYERRLDI